MRLLRLVTLFSLLAGALPADSADDIARIHTEAIGGERRMKLLQSLRATGRVNIDDRVLTFQLLAQRPNRLRMETRAEGRRLIQATDGVSPPWQLDPDALPLRVTRLQGEEAREFAADAEFDDPLVDYAARGYALDYAGVAQVEGRRVLRLLVTRRLVDSYLLLLDAETYFILRKIATRTRGGREIKMETVYDDFRPVAGIIIPHRYFTYADGRLLHETILDSVVANAAVPEDSFSAPLIISVPEISGAGRSP
jgi:hypothetical protein